MKRQQTALREGGFIDDARKVQASLNKTKEKYEKFLSETGRAKVPMLEQVSGFHPVKETLTKHNTYGGYTGAYNNINDKNDLKRYAHANTYYEEIRNSNIDSLAIKLSSSANISKDYALNIIHHVFLMSTTFMMMAILEDLILVMRWQFVFRDYLKERTSKILT